MSRKFVTLGWQFTCRAANNPEGCNDPDKTFEDAWQNPDQGRAMLRAAQAHADRTGHSAIVDRHQRVVIEPSAVQGGRNQ